MDEGYPRAKWWPVVVLASAAVVAALAFIATRDRGPGPAPTVEAPQAAVDPAEEGVLTPEPPGFDVVRVGPDGSALVAGTAEPGATVTIYADEAPLTEVEADREGNFVAIFRVEPSVTPRALTLGSAGPGGAWASSGEVVMLLPEPPAPPEPETAPAATAGEPAQSPEGVAAALAETAAEPEPEVAATAIIREDRVEVSPVGSAGAEGVALVSISYAGAGEVTLAGLGTSGAVVRAYVDDRFAEEARVGSDGRWSLDLPDIASGLYTLRIDQIAPDGQVASRVETPFQRDYPRAPLPRPGQLAPVPGTGVVTVQPGNNLWTLARLHYGSGVLYTQIFTANRDQIREPDLIYPGQIFTMPEMDAE